MNRWNWVVREGWRIVGLGVVGLLLIVALAACGSGDSANTSGSASTSPKASATAGSTSGTVTATPEATAAPTAQPTQAPTAVPTAAPTAAPTPVPTAPPTQAPIVTQPPAQSYACEAGATCNCSDFPTHAEAQRIFELHGGSPSNNWAGLDSNHNGIACESLP